MFLATTALEEFWDDSDEILFLGSWCLLHRRKDRWEKMRSRVLPSPWDRSGATDEGIRACRAARESLLPFLALRLNEAHGTRYDERSWRRLLGPWLLGFTTAFYDHLLHVDAALTFDPGLRTWRMDPHDYVTPRDTIDGAVRLPTDGYNLQIYSQVFAHLGVASETRRFAQPGSAAPRGKTGGALSRLAKSAAASVLRRRAAPVRFSNLYLGRKDVWTLMKATGFRAWPLGAEAPAPPSAVPPHPSRAALSGFPASGRFEGLLAAALPTELPALYLEGFAAMRESIAPLLTSPPKALLTSVGWLGDEPLKLLAVESASTALVICQHGGAYGLHAPLQSEEHERLVADQYWTWGWDDPESLSDATKLKPMPNPRLTPLPEDAISSSREFLLITHSRSRYPYTHYFTAVPAYHRYPDHLRNQARFVAALPSEARAAMTVRLPPNDHGWDLRERLSDSFADLRFDAARSPWLESARRMGLVLIDHPETSMLEALASGVPTILFWDPALWLMRGTALPYLDALRRAGVLYDAPEEAAAKAAAVYRTPLAWWRESGVRQAREAFVHRFARGSRDWPSQWAGALEAWS